MSSVATAAADSGELLDQYETLRSNALGQFNEPCRLLIFKEGMASWLRAFVGTTAEQPAPGSFSCVRPAEANCSALISILADAILEANGPAISGANQ